MMRIKQNLLAALTLLLYAGAAAQDAAPADGERQRAALQQIAAAAAGMKSLACRFEQTKVASMLSDKQASTGKMYYRQAGCLRWEYDPPVEYTFVLNNSHALMLAGAKRISDPKMSRFFREIAGIMMNGVGGSGLSDTKNFDVTCREGAAHWEVALVPRRKELKKMFASINLTFNSKDYTADRIELNESNGDVTAIRLFGKQLNVEIDDEKFKLE
jgi:outer membrane lipoprotein-sorting protein